MVADTPDEEWQALRASARLPLAGAENLRGLDHIDLPLDGSTLFSPMLASGAV